MNGVTSRSRIMSSCHTRPYRSWVIVTSITSVRPIWTYHSHHTNGALTQRVSSTGSPQSDGVLNKTDRMKIQHYRPIYADRTDPIVFLTITVSTSGHVYEDFTRLLFLHTHRETSILSGELPEESEQFRFLWVSHLTNLKGSVGLILAKTSTIWVTIPIDLSTRSFIPLPLFLNSRRVSPLLTQSLVLIPQQSTVCLSDTWCVLCWKLYCLTMHHSF
jgi:hypothetical protein